MSVFGAVDFIHWHVVSELPVLENK